LKAMKNNLYLKDILDSFRKQQFFYSVLISVSYIGKYYIILYYMMYIRYL